MSIRFIIQLLQITGFMALVVAILTAIPFYFSLTNGFLGALIGLFLIGSAVALVFAIYDAFKRGKIVIGIALSFLLVTTFFLNTFASLDFFLRYINEVGTYSTIALPVIVNLLPLFFSYLSLVLKEYE